MSVTALCAGSITTSFESTAAATDTVLYKWMPSTSAAVVAPAGYRGMMRGSGVVIPEVVSKLLALAGELPPRRIALEVNRLLLRPVR